MEDWEKIRERLGTSLGSICLIATFLLLSPGVRVVQAGDETAPALMSTDPALVQVQPAAEQAEPAQAPSARIAPPAAPEAPAVDTETAHKPGLPGVEVAPGVIVLNTRGFNYGPPPSELDPAALQAENLQK